MSIELIVRKLLICYPILLFSITVHEYFHGLIAEKRGDDTARMLGRLTLNPIPHIDIFGTVILPILCMLSPGMLMFGWAKPVPVNPNRLKDPRKDMLLIGLAGPLSNFGLALTAGLCFRLVGSNVGTASLLFFYLVYLNVILGVFNLIPVPPLDGSRVLAGLLPYELAYQYEKIGRYGFFIIIFLFYSGIMWTVLGPIIRFLISLLIGGRIYG